MAIGCWLLLLVVVVVGLRKRSFEPTAHFRFNITDELSDKIL
jgi:hypothetical protein